MPVKRRTNVPLGWTGFNGGHKPAISFAQLPEEEEDEVGELECPRESMRAALAGLGLCSPDECYNQPLSISSFSNVTIVLSAGPYILPQILPAYWEATIGSFTGSLYYVERDCPPFGSVESVSGPILMSASCGIEDGRRRVNLTISGATVDAINGSFGFGLFSGIGVPGLPIQNTISNFGPPCTIGLFSGAILGYGGSVTIGSAPAP